jgi:serine/threonine protein phosphatase 1
MTARILAIGDIHGCDVALEKLLGAVAPRLEDTVVVLGDVVDRGPNVRRCIDLLIDLKKRCELVFLLGNHEEMMLNAAATGDWLNAWLGFGGIEALQSYGLPPRFSNVPEAHWEFLRSGREFFETSRDLFVHANIDPDIPLGQQSGPTLRWSKLLGSEPPHPSGKRVVCGHTSLRSGLPAVFPGWVCIDTYCYGGHWLTCLDVTTDRIWQASQAGQARGPALLRDVATPLE